ncbi:hypothetical protein SESBI_50779, partial [Sesbania bispinosa]
IESSRDLDSIGIHPFNPTQPPITNLQRTQHPPYHLPLSYTSNIHHMTFHSAIHHSSPQAHKMAHQF